MAFQIDEGEMPKVMLVLDVYHSEEIHEHRYGADKYRNIVIGFWHTKGRQLCISLQLKGVQYFLMKTHLINFHTQRPLCSDNLITIWTVLKIQVSCRTFWTYILLIGLCFYHIPYVFTKQSNHGNILFSNQCSERITNSIATNKKNCHEFVIN